MPKSWWMSHPFLFAIYPILLLYIYNMDEVPFSDIIPSILAVLLVTTLLLFLLRLVTKSNNKRGIVTSFFLILFFHYGYIAQIFNRLAGWVTVTVFLCSLWIVLFLSVFFLILRSRRNFNNLTLFLNTTGAAIILILLISAGFLQIKNAGSAPDRNSTQNSGVSTAYTNVSGLPDTLPDIYYIIVDSYARASTLKEIYGYDNSEFLDYLAGKGFYIASQSRSNYAHTLLSITAALNMDYINTQDLSYLEEALPNNNIASLFKNMGYRVIYVSSGFYNRNFGKNTDVYLPKSHVFGIVLNDFVINLIQSTALEPFRWIVGNDQRQDILYVFNILGKMPDIKVPKLVIAHLQGVHTPFVFDREGHPNKALIPVAGDIELYYLKGYGEQLTFINKKLVEMVNEILSNSETQPIIILQGDHGPAFTRQFNFRPDELTSLQLDERMNIFNSYLVPSDVAAYLYQSITPVNSFRIILNHYFGANYDLLIDRSYFSNPSDYLQFYPVP